MTLRVASSVAYLALVVAGAGCAALLDLPAPELGEGGVTLDASAEDSAEDSADGTVDSSRDTEVPVDRAAPPETGGEASIDGTSRDVAPETAAADVGPDQASDAQMMGVLCSFSQQYCDPATKPLCCETPNDGGPPSFACTSSATCGSAYTIECSNDNDCPNNNICCHYGSAMRCEPPTQTGSNCPGQGGTQACDPGNPNECLGTQTCTANLVNAGLPSPYMGCE